MIRAFLPRQWRFIKIHTLTPLELDAKCMLALEVSLSTLKILFEQSLKFNDIIQSQRSSYRHRFLCARKLQRCCSKLRWKISFNYRLGGGGGGGLGAPGGGGGLGVPVGGGGFGAPLCWSTSFGWKSRLRKRFRFDVVRPIRVAQNGSDC